MGLEIAVVAAVIAPLYVIAELIIPLPLRLLAIINVVFFALGLIGAIKTNFKNRLLILGVVLNGIAIILFFALNR